MDRYIRCAAALAVFVAVDVSQSHATNYTWNVGNSVWVLFSNWNPQAVPGPSDTAYIANGGTAIVNATASCQELLLGGGSSGSVQLVSGGSLQVGSNGEYVGYTGSGSVLQTAGTNDASASFLSLGHIVGASGTYNLSGSGYVVSPTENIGDAGNGAFIQSGGTNLVSTGLYLSGGGSASGTYNLSGSGYVAASTEYVGNFGSGVFNQSGGTNSVTGGLAIGPLSSATGSYILSGGYLTAPSESLGNTGSGAFTQSSGTNSVTSYLAVGVGSGGGSYSLGGSGYVSVPTEYVGDLGNGTFTQNGGLNSVTSSLYVGDNSQYGTYALSGGSLAAPTEYLGFALGSGTFAQTGGTNMVSSTLQLGNGGSYGAYTLGGGLLVTPMEYVGYSLAGSGAFSQSGGTHSITSVLIVGYSGSVFGSYSLTGGSLTASVEDVGFNGSGAFVQSGGTNNVTNFLKTGANAGDSGSYALSGSGYLAAPTEYIGYNGSSTFTQSGGTNAASGVLYLGLGSTGSGRYSLNGGLLTAGTTSVGASSTFIQSGGAIGPGELLNSGSFSYSSGAFNAQFVNSGSASFGTSFDAAGGLINNSTIAVPAGILVGVNGGANTLDNEGTAILSGGTLAGGQSAGNGGPIVNNGLITGYGALTSGVGITNNSQIVQDGGSLVVSTGSSTMTNAGAISLEAGYQLRLNGGTLANGGSINLNSATIAGSGLLNNASGGNISGPGTISAPFQNPGGNLSVPLGTTTVALAFTNSGAIQIGGVGANLAGGLITNFGTIVGNGAVSNSFSNAGIIEALGGALSFSGSVQNVSGGQISATAGGDVLVAIGLANNFGVINLTGGIFDNNAHQLINHSQISGYGTWQTGGLTNLNEITLAGAASTVNGPVTNASGGSISIYYNPAIFTGTVVNNGYVKSTGTTVTWAGGFTNSGTYLSDPAVNYFSSLANGSSGLLQGGVGDQFIITGPLLSNAGQIYLGGTSTMVVDNGSGTLAQTSGTLEMGTGATLSAGSVAINGGILLADGPAAMITANLLYASTSSSTYQGAVVGGGNSLTIDNPSSLLVLSGTNTFGGGTFVTAGELIATNPLALHDGSSLVVGNPTALAAIIPDGGAAGPSTVAVPEPGTFPLLAAGAGISAAFGASRSKTTRRRIVSKSP
jgi:hypothetical protein